jgi:hypothetical protein
MPSGSYIFTSFILRWAYPDNPIQVECLLPQTEPMTRILIFPIIHSPWGSIRAALERGEAGKLKG